MTVEGLTIGQRNRLIALARAGRSLPWAEGDDDLAKMRLVQRYREPFGEDLADLTSAGLAAAQRARKNGRP